MGRSYGVPGRGWFCRGPALVLEEGSVRLWRALEASTTGSGGSTVSYAAGKAQSGCCPSAEDSRIAAPTQLKRCQERRKSDLVELGTLIGAGRIREP